MGGGCMPKKAARNTKSRIVSAAWKLFYEQGYDNTTVDDIIYESETSKGSFYHYFNGKDALLHSLSILFDEKYDELAPSLNEYPTATQKLLFLNRELFSMIENSIPLELLKGLYSTQLVTKGEKHLLDRSRSYYRMLRSIISEGLQKGEFCESFTASEIEKAYALCERALIYDWCLSEGEYSLRKYATQILPMFLAGFLSKK